MIVDCFTFFNEIEILKLRLSELNSIVDRFVIVESNTTFQGHPKPLHYLKNKHLFKKYEHKIIHIVYDGSFHAGTAWDREFGQRNAIRQGIKDLSPNDHVIISDVDEIISHDMISTARNRGEFQFLILKNFYYYMDLYSEVPWIGPYITSKRHIDLLDDLSRPRMRSWNYCVDIGSTHHETILHDCGWHLSWLGGIEKVIYKIKSYSHVEHSEWADQEKIKSSMANKKFFVGLDLSVVPLAELPAYVQQDAVRLFRLGYLLERPAMSPVQNIVTDAHLLTSRLGRHIRTLIKT